MEHSLLRKRTGRSRVFVTAAVAVAGTALGASLFGSGPVDRPDRPGSHLAAQLDALRGANDLVRAGRAEVGRDPALYPTAYGRLEAALLTGGRAGGEPVPGIRPAALARLVRTDLLDTPAWRAHYVCLSLSAAKDSQHRPQASRAPGTARVADADAAAVLERAGLRAQAESEALGYLRAPAAGDDAVTSLATRAAFLRTAACLGRADQVSRGVLSRLAADTARADQPVPALYAVEALRVVGVRVRATRVLRHADADADRRTADCAGAGPMERAASALLGARPTRQTRDCLRFALHDPDPQTRWLVRRALALGTADTSASLPVPLVTVRPDGLVAKSPTQLGTLTATYNAARALSASGRQRQAPVWLKRRLKQLGSDPGLDPSDRLPLAMTCHRLSLSCGPQAEKGAEEAAKRAVPARMTTRNQHSWYGATAARAEFGLGCPRTFVAPPAGKGTALPAVALRTVVVLADAGCATQAQRLTAGTDLVHQARLALHDGELTVASDAVQAALATDQSIPQTFWDELPASLKPYRDAEFPDLYADSPGGTASADATRAAYYLLA